MSDSVTSTPTPEAAAPAPAPAAPEAKLIPKASRFRTDASLANDPLLNPPPKEEKATPPKDPATGKFVKQSADPNAGVIPELQRQEEVQQQEEPAPQDEPQAQPEPTPAKPTFTPVEIDMGDGRVSVFKTQEALNNHFKRMADAQSAADARAAALARVQGERVQQPATPTEPEFKNPFEASLIDDEPLMKQMMADIEDPDKGPGIAIARVVERVEKKTADLVKFLQHQHEQAMKPMNDFLGAMNSINETAEFFAGAANHKRPDGTPTFPGIQNRKAITELTQVMQKHNLPLTPQNFELAYQVWRGTSNSGELRPQQGQPRPDNSSAASAAAVVSGQGARVPDLRAERRPRTFREDMDAVPLNRGRFRTEG